MTLLQKLTLGFAGVALACLSIVTCAPADFPFLWGLKATAMFSGGFGLLLLDPTKAISVLTAAAPKS